MTAFAGEIHPLADLYPLLPADELAALADDIKANGQEAPILLDSAGRLVDGRNRLRACELAGVEPWFEADPHLSTYAAVARVVRSRNNRRRHMGTGQVAAADALTMAAEGLRRNGRWARGSVVADPQVTDPDRFLMARAGVVLDWAPDLLPQVAAGTLALDAAYQKAQTARDDAEAEQREAERAAHQLATLRGNAPDLADLVDAEQLPLKEAIAAWAERTRKDREAEAARADAIRANNRDITEAIYRLHLLAGHPQAVARWHAAYDPDHAIHPLDPAQLADAIDVLTRLEASL